VQVALSIQGRFVPLLPGVQDALDAGVASTAYAGNALLLDRVDCKGSCTDLLPALCDPQTSGVPLAAPGYRVRQYRNFDG
jgi:hypothetical protein